MTTEQKEILLVGGPRHGATVFISPLDFSYGTHPNRYDIAYFGAKDAWVGIHQSVAEGNRYMYAMNAISVRDQNRESHRVDQLKAWEAINALASKLRNAQMAFGVGVAPKEKAKPVEDDGLTRITIKTTKPDKWRFIDTETGQTWRWDTEKNTFVLVVYNHD